MEQFHIHLKEGDPGKYVILTGDPGRVETIAHYLDNPTFVNQNREFTTWNGYLQGQKVSVVSTGIGGPSAAIAMEELIHLGADTFIRIGTCGGMQPNLIPGTLIIPTASIRMEGTSHEYMPAEFPAVADFTLTRSLVDSAEELGYAYTTGIVQSKDSFYGQHSPKTMPVGEMLEYKWEAWKKGGVLASEMETAALFTVASVRGVRCGAILQMLWNQERETVNTEKPLNDMSAAIQTVITSFCKIMK